MKRFFFLFALIPQFAMAGTIVLTLSAEQGLSKLKLPGEIIFESTNGFCEERGLIPQPWSAPRKQKLVPKVVSLSGNSVVLEITTDPKKQDICKYKFASYTVWSDDNAFFVSLDATNKSNINAKDAIELELTANENSLFSVDCVAKKNYQRKCTLLKDGVKKGYAAGNGSRLYIDMKKLEAHKEIHPSIEFRRIEE
jgi:hypothetical protein